MKIFTLSTLGLLAALSSFAVVPTVWASGNHAHGHAPMDTNMKVANPIGAEETGFGRQGMSKEVTRTIAVSMSDMMRFTPDSLNVKQGETVRLRITNNGRIPHEFVLGTRAEITEHAEMMKKNPEMEHADANAARVAPGKTGDIIWQFTQPGKFLYACLIPGHWDAGMQGTVSVTGNKAMAANASAASAAMADQPMKAMPDGNMKNMASADKFTSGEIRKVDMVQGKLTIKHGDIKNLGMPGMTMMFRVKDPAMLQSVKAGDAVQFVVEKQAGALVITELKKTSE